MPSRLPRDVVVTKDFKNSMVSNTGLVMSSSTNPCLVILIIFIINNILHLVMMIAPQASFLLFCNLTVVCKAYLWI